MLPFVAALAILIPPYGISQVEDPEKLAAPRPGKTIYLQGGVWHQDIPFAKGEVINIAAHSAGAHSAAFIALDPCNRGKIKCVELMSGVYRVGPGVRLVAHGAFRGQSRFEASPLFNIPPACSDSPTFHLYYATHDLPGQRLQSLRMYDALRCAGYSVTLTEVCADHYNLPAKLGYCVD